MQPRQGQHEVPNGRAVFVEARVAAIAIQLERQGCEIHAIGGGHRPPGIGLDVFPEDEAVMVGQDLVAAVGKAPHRAD